MGRAACGAVIAVGAWLLAAPPAPAQLPLIEPAPPLARIAYSANGTVYTLAADGSARTALARNAAQPSWSPDGGSIAYAQAPNEEDVDESRIWVSAPDGSGARRVSRPPRGWSDDSPTWSPDGARIAFVRSRFSDRRGLVTSIVSAAAGGGDERRILTLASRRITYLAAPAWSPDGARILVTQTTFSDEDEEDVASSLLLVDVSTGERRRLVRGADGAWSPNGDRIAYVAERRSCRAADCEEVYVANADGGGRRLLTTNEAEEAGPAWSADGERIAFTSTRNYPDGDAPEVYSVRTDGTCLTWLTNGTAVPRDPAWEPRAGLSTEPGSCGAVEREPVIETDLRDLAQPHVWWLGPRYGNLLVSEAFAVDGDVFVDYGDCARFEPSECTQAVGLLVRPVCATDVLSSESGFATGRGLTRHEGALVHHEEIDPGLEATNEVYVGSTAIGVSESDGERPPSPELLDALRRYGEDAPPDEGLPRAELPRSFWRTLEQTRALRRKLGGVRAVQRRLRIPRRAVVDRLRLDRRLRQLGPFGRIDCED